MLYFVVFKVKKGDDSRGLFYFCWVDDVCNWRCMIQSRE